MRAFHIQEMMKQKIYDNILARQCGVDYSPGIHFETFLSTWKKKNHSPRAMNWENQIRSNKYGAGVAPSITYTLSQGIALWGFLIIKSKNGFGGGSISR